MKEDYRKEGAAFFIEYGSFTRNKSGEITGLKVRSSHRHNCDKFRYLVGAGNITEKNSPDGIFYELSVANPEVARETRKIIADTVMEVLGS